jgi:hypothetical protein
MTFTDFIMAQPRRRGMRGEFIADAQSDIRGGRFPNDVTTWRRLESFLFFGHACPEAIRAGRAIFYEWRASHGRIAT